MYSHLEPSQFHFLPYMATGWLQMYFNTSSRCHLLCRNSGMIRKQRHIFACWNLPIAEIYLADKMLWLGSGPSLSFQSGLAANKDFFDAPYGPNHHQRPPILVVQNLLNYIICFMSVVWKLFYQNTIQDHCLLYVPTFQNWKLSRWTKLWLRQYSKHCNEWMKHTWLMQTF